MTAPNYCVLEGDPTNAIAPRRPDVLCEDMGGLQFQDSATFPPRPNEHVSAKDFKQVEMLVQRLCRMMPVLVVEVTGTGTSHTLLSVTSAVDSLTAANVTITHGPDGVFAIAWPSGKLPAKTRKPHAYTTDTASTTVSIFPAQTANSVIVATVSSATGVPGNFTTTYAIEIFGE